MSNSRVEQLRRRHPTFTYESYSWERLGNALKIRFLFTIEPTIRFSPETIIESVDEKILETFSDGALEHFIFHLGLVEMLSYWKSTCAPEIVVHAGFLDNQQREWWKDLLQYGMREFFYVNNIDFRSPDFVNIFTSGVKRESTGPYVRAPLQDRDLVFVSGGKDSTLALQLLREVGRPFDCLLLNPTPAATAIGKQIEGHTSIVVRRTIDPFLLELNKAGYLNGHTPFSAYLAFLGVTTAFLFGYPRVIAANERSSDEGNVRYLDNEVNHQYSKTLRFETAFRWYTQTYLTTEVNYFSLLRPLYAIQVSRLFADYPQYFDSFLSCNRGQRDGSWCHRCAKCLSTFILLHPFVSVTELTRIFGADLFTQEEVTPLVRELAGLSPQKPFECVGTTEEMLVALYLSIQQVKKLRAPLPVVLGYVEKEILPRYPQVQQHVKPVLSAWSENHHVPQEYGRFLKNRVTAHHEAY